MSLFTELKRRNVFRMAVLYVVAAWLVMQVAGVLMDLGALPPAVGPWVLVVLVIGFPIALVFSWLFEITPEGLAREKDVSEGASITHITGRRMDFIVISLLCAAVLLFAYDKWWTGPPPERSVAVLPFVNMSGDANNEYFSDGLTETLLNMLAQVPGLKVTGRTSSFAFKGRNVGIPEIAATLGVANVLEGSVQRDGDRMRVTAQLIRADDGFHVWSQNYTRQLEDIFAIQDEIASEVAQALGRSLVGAAQPDLRGVATSNFSAYDSYLKGLEQQAIFSYDSLDQAENQFKQALVIDPDFIDARLALARNYWFKSGNGMMDRQQAKALIAPEIDRVRQQQPANHLARALELRLALGDYDTSVSAPDIQAAVAELQHLVQALPTEWFVRTKLSAELYRRGEKQQAIELLKAGVAIDPLDTRLHAQLSMFYRWEGRLDDARSEMQRCLELAPGNPSWYVGMGKVEGFADDLPAALDWLRQATEVDSRDHEPAAEIASTLYLLRLPDQGDYWRDRVRKLAPDSGVAHSLDVERAAARDEPQQLIALASAAVAEQIDTRLWAFSTSLFYYTDTMLREQRAREAYNFLVSVQPKITAYGEVMPDRQSETMQEMSIVLMSGFETFEKRQAAWRQFTAKFDARGTPDPSDTLITWDYLMNGEVEKAIEHYLQYEMNEPLARSLDRHRKPLYDLYAPVYEDPRVAARLAEDTRRYEAVRKEVIAMLQRPEWSTGN